MFALLKARRVNKRRRHESGDVLSLATLRRTFRWAKGSLLILGILLFALYRVTTRGETIEGHWLTVFVALLRQSVVAWPRPAGWAPPSAAEPELVYLSRP